MIPPLLALLTPACVGSSSSSSAGGLFLNNLQEYLFHFNQTSRKAKTKWIDLETTEKKTQKQNSTYKCLFSKYGHPLMTCSYSSGGRDVFFPPVFSAEWESFQSHQHFKGSSYPIPHKNCGHIRPASVCLMGLFLWGKKKTKKKHTSGLCLLGATHHKTFFK